MSKTKNYKYTAREVEIKKMKDKNEIKFIYEWLDSGRPLLKSDLVKYREYINKVKDGIKMEFFINSKTKE